MDFMQAMDVVERGFRTWAEKPYNKKWFAQIDGTPIHNDLCVNIAEAVVKATSDDDHPLLQMGEDLR